MPRRSPSMIHAMFVLMLAVALQAGCARQVLQYRDSGRTLRRSDLVGIARDVDPGAASRVSLDDAPSLRTKALTELRSHGDAAQRLADALTAQLPPDYAGVPVYVESATVDGRASWFIVEVRPSGGGAGPADRRYWVFDRSTLQVVESGTL